MAAVKTRWSMLILEDHPDLRETLQSNFDDLFFKAIHLDFAASICQAVDKIKRRMREGDPYDAFWIDLYLDYFSYDNEHGEIVAVDSFSQIVDTARLLHSLQLENPDLTTLLTRLRAEVKPPHKPPASCSDQEKLNILGKFLPYCHAPTKSCYATFLDLVDFYLRSDDFVNDELRNANIYARQVLDFVFFRFIQWVQNPHKREFSLYAEQASGWTEPQNLNILPKAEDKSDHSWTIFHAWVRQFYSAVAAWAKDVEEYTSANPLLLEVKHLMFNDYPQFLINTAYAGRRQDFVASGSVWSSGSVTVTHNTFKGEKKNAELLEYLFRIFRHLRRPYFLLKSRRRGNNAFVLKDNDLAKAVQADSGEPHRLLLSDAELGLAFTAQTFFPELFINFNKLPKASHERAGVLVANVRSDLQTEAQARKPQKVGVCRLHLPGRFLETPHHHDSFQLEVQALSGKWLQPKLSCDEGRWAFWELACRLWFPKCFLMHSKWKARAGQEEMEIYFPPAEKLIARALHQAAHAHKEVFPPPAVLDKIAIALRPTAAFYAADGDYISAFEWEAFGREIFAPIDGEETPALALQAKRLLYLVKYMLAELHIHRLSSHVLTATRLTPASLCDLMAHPKFDSAQSRLAHSLGQIEHASKTLIAEYHLPGIKNLFAAILCFHTLPAPELVALYHFWQGKHIPLSGVRPIEKFSAISKKLEHVQFVESRALPVQTEDKKKYLFIPAALIQKPSLLLNLKASSPHADYPPPPLDLALLTCRDFLQLIPDTLL